eukprot:347175_1
MLEKEIHNSNRFRSRDKKVDIDGSYNKFKTTNVNTFSGAKYMKVVKNAKQKCFVDVLLDQMNGQNISKKEVSAFDAFIYFEEYDTESIMCDMEDVAIDNNSSNFKQLLNVSAKFQEIYKGLFQEKQIKQKLYSSGKRYFYWDFYKYNNEERNMIVPGYLNPVGEALYEENNGYRLCDWYINKKYMNFKMELLNNLICRFNLEQYNDTLVKATDKLKAWIKDPNVPNIECKTWLWRQNYGIKQGEPISVQHIMSLMCYTNYSKQSYEFTATYRQYGDYESDKDMKSRHREYWNWGKLLRETVECFGDFLNERVHHGINDTLVFNSTSVLLCGPVSTTADFAIAANTFGAKGLVIDIPKDAIAFYFNCRYFSDFTSEDERLLIGGLSEIKFDTIRNMQPTPKQNYKVYVTALTIFHKMINGFVWEEKVKSRYRKVLKKLIKEEISGKVVKALPSNVPTYILHLWHHFLSTIK